MTFLLMFSFFEIFFENNKDTAMIFFFGKILPGFYQTHMSRFPCK